ncbi:MAG: type II toxin-antitoxin system HicB family antitoxin [Chloroflexota bacterium]
MDEKWLKQAERLAMRPYFIKVALDETTDNEPIYIAHVLELEGCFGQGEDPESAVADLRSAMVDFIAILLEDGLPVPEPADLVMTTSSTTSKTVTMANYAEDKNIVSIPQRNIYVPAG